MCDMQNMPSRDDTSCDEDSEMNFATFAAGGAHFVTTGGQLPVTKIQQNVSNNGNSLSQMVGMVGGVTMGEGGMQYVRSLDGGTSLQPTPQLISVPIALPGVKPGDPQPTVQIQVLNPNLLQTQQQPKYHMQIPIQGLQNGAVLTLAYSPETNDAGTLQLVGQNSLGEGLQVLTALSPDLQVIQPSQTRTHDSEHNQPTMHQVFITPNQQIIINGPDKALNNNTDNNNPNITNITIKEECEENIDDESSQGTETSDSMSYPSNPSDEALLIKYLNQFPQEKQSLPASLQQFLRLKHTEAKKQMIEVEVPPEHDKTVEAVAEAILSEDGTLRIKSKKRKKYKKKPSKPARPKPGQVVIATAADGTPIYCCPECQMAYREKDELEQHLSVHKIERRFICGICGAGLKRKEHLERHKLGHNPERPYVCSVCTKGFKRREHLNLHAVLHSGVKTEICGECGKGFYRKDHLRKHTRSHESKRAREQADAATAEKPQPANNNTSSIPEITIHIPTSSSMQVPIEINIPQHLVTSLASAQQQQQQQQAHETLDALLAQHT
uniref:C2H2-type domain-containing protein n=1 Tax=Bombyx mori TaxID=7091 RepID=A0A8R2HLL4_BOMMO|nr:transcriptional regulator CRZ2 [Bombyx mori]